MTQTRQWLESRRAELRRREAMAVLAVTGGAVFALFGLGLVLAAAGVYQRAPVVALVAWLAVVGVIAGGMVALRRRLRAFNLRTLARAVEEQGRLRRGTVWGMVGEPGSGSRSLFAIADSTTLGWLSSHGRGALTPVRKKGMRSVWAGALVGLVGASLFLWAGPTDEEGGAFWRPHTLLSAIWAPVRLEVDAEQVRRGERVTATVSAFGRSSVSLSTRSPGEPWSVQPVTLDSTGTAVITLGPLDTDLYVRASSGRRASRTVHVRVTLPAFIATLALRARFPNYLDRVDEQLFAGDSVFLPAGTRLVAEGQVTVPVGSATWMVDGRHVAELTVDESRFRGTTPVTRSGLWQLQVVPADRPLDDRAPSLHLTVVPDSAPVVAVPVPGADTVASANLLQSLVVDVRDDYAIMRVELESWRVGQAGVPSDTMVETLFVPDGVADRAVLPWVLDLNRRGFLPGDTAFYRVRAVDNAPSAQVGMSPTFALRLPSRAEQRRDLREAAAHLTQTADSLAEAQRRLSEETETLASANPQQVEQGEQRGEGLQFEQAQRAQEVQEQQDALVERARQLAQQLEDLSESGWEAGVTDQEWHKQLEQLRELLEQSLTPEMMSALEQLSEALEQLDPQAVQEALQQLAEQQEQLQENMERSRELLERAALEGAMSTLAEDAQDLAQQQEQWNEAAEQGTQSDSALAAGEEQLAQQAQELQEQMQQAQQAMEEANRNGQQMQDAQQRMSDAMQQMQNAAQQAQEGQRQQAQQSGEAASEQLNPMAQDLQQQLEQLRQDMRQEVLDAMDQALMETADLAQRQQDVTNRLQSGESGSDVRGEQAALREAVDRVMEQLQDAAGKNALVSPELSTALGFARVRMTEALTQFEQPAPNTRQAAEMAGQAVDGLNAVAAQLMRNRGDVEGSSSGSGMAEAMEQMAEMAAQQEAMNGQTSSLLPMMPQGGQQLLQQLQEIADRQQQLSEQLEQMAAQEGLPGGTQEMAEDAEEIAEQLRSGQLDRETLERQEQLFRRLLDAGRSLRSDQEDEREERQSETAQANNVRLPADLAPDALGGARYPYPDWQQLRRFTPEQRRLILDYFRRLNRARP